MAIKNAQLLMILAVVAIAALVFGGYVTIKTPGGYIGGGTQANPTQIPGGGLNGIFAGNLAVSTTWINHAASDASTALNATVKILHADGTLFGTTSVGATITGQVKTADMGKLQIIMTPVATAYIDKDWTVSQNTGLLTSVSPTVVSGVTVYKFVLDVASQAPLGAGETSRTVNLIIGEYASDTTLTFTSLANATASTYSGTTYIAASASGYLASMTQETAAKIVKVEISMPTAANISLYDNGQVKNIQVILGMGNGQAPLYISSWNHYTGSTYLTGNIGVSDVSQEYYGLPVVYGTADSPTALSYTVNAQCANFVQADVFRPSLLVTVISPAGVTSTVTAVLAYADT